VRSLLLRTGGATVDDLVARFHESRSSAYRDLEALRGSGEAVEEEHDGRTRRYSIKRRARADAMKFTLNELIALVLALSSMSAFQGTGLDDDVRTVVVKVECCLQRHDRDFARELGRKVHDVNEAPRIYAERTEDLKTLIALPPPRTDLTGAGAGSRSLRCARPGKDHTNPPSHILGRTKPFETRSLGAASPKCLRSSKSLVFVVSIGEIDRV
jgi:hypothetical protein